MKQESQSRGDSPKGQAATGTGSRVGRVILASILGTVIVGFLLLGVTSRKYVLFAMTLTLILLYLVLIALWNSVEDGRAILKMDAIDVPVRWVFLLTGATLVILSVLGSALSSRIFQLPAPLINLGWEGLPNVLFFAGVIFISLPVVSFKPGWSSHEMKFNIGYPVLFVSFLAYLVILIIDLMYARDSYIVDGIRIWLLLQTLGSGVVVLVSEILRERRSAGD